VVRAAKGLRPFEHRVEDWRQIARRGIDDTQHLGGRGLLLQRLTRLGNEPRIFHRYHCLSGEVFE